MRIMLGHTDGNVTFVDAPDDNTLREVLNDITALWPEHGVDDPIWAAAEDGTYATAIAQGYPGCTVKTMDDAVLAYRQASGGTGPVSPQRGTSADHRAVPATPTPTEA